MSARAISAVLATAILVYASPAWPAPKGLDKVLSGEDALSFAAGTVLESLPIDGTVTRITGDNKTTGNRRLLAKGDIVYLTLDEPEKAFPGDVFTVYEHVLEVLHPSDNGFMGNLYTMTAVLKIVEGGQNPATSTVIRSYSAILPGDRVMRFVAPKGRNPGQGVTPPGGPGMIVHLTPGRTLIAQGNIVYIDWGWEHGLRKGDRLEVFRDTEGLPRRVIGELKVLGVGEFASSAMVVRSKYNHLRGDQFVFKKAAPLVAEADAGNGDRNTAVSPGTALDGSEFTDGDSRSARSLAGSPVAGNHSLVLDGVLDQLLFDSGEVVIKPKGREVLARVSEMLREAGNRQIRVEGHTDNVEIGPTLKETYPTNWELSQARAGEVVRYLVEEGGLQASNFSSVGHADTQPVATNANERGRSKNRRVEILVSSVSSVPGVEPAPAPLRFDDSSLDEPSPTVREGEVVSENGSEAPPSPSVPPSDE